MKRRLKLLAVIAGAPALLVLLTAVLLPVLVDSNHYKSKLIAFAKAHTGRDLHIDGELRLRLLPRLQLTATNVRLENPPGYVAADLAAFASLSLGVDPMRLLEGRIEADTISVRGLALHLERDADGRGNWEGLASGEAANRDAADASLVAIAVGGLEISDASFSWRDDSTGTLITLPAIDIETGALRDGRRIDDVRVSVALAGANSPAGPAIIEARGDVTLAAEGRTLTVSNFTAAVNDAAVAGTRVDGTLTAQLSVDIPRQRLRFDALHASASISGASDARATVEITTGLDFDFSRQRLAPSMLSVKVPTYSVSGVGGQLVLNGVLDGDLRAGTFALKAVQSAGTMGDDRSPGDRRPFRFSAHLGLAEQLRTLTAKHLQLSIAGLQTAGELTLHAVQAPPGVRGNFDLTVEGQKLKGSVAVAEAGAGVDLHLDVTADLDIDDGRYGLRGSNAMALRARVSPTPQEQRYRVADLQLDAYLSDTSAADGRLPVSLRADLDVDLKNESIRSENLRLDVADDRIVGSVDVRRFGAPAVRFDLEADAIDADRLLPPIPENADVRARATPVSATIDAVRSLDLNGEMRVETLTLRGLQMKKVRFRSRSGANDG